MSESPNPIDIHVGRRLRQRRTLLGMSQERLGELLGVTFQQVQKYERGANRIGSSRLYDLGRILDVPVSYFFEDMPSVASVPAPGVLAPGGFAPPAYALQEASAGTFVFDAPQPVGSGVDTRETLELVRAFNRIHDGQVRRRLFELTKALADMAYREEA